MNTNVDVEIYNVLEHLQTNGNGGKCSVDCNMSHVNCNHCNMSYVETLECHNQHTH